MRLPDWVSLRARTAPDVIAVEADDASLTYAELDRRVGAAASALRSAGAGRGERVALLAGASSANVVAVHAVARTGAALVPLNARLTDAEVAWQLEDCRATLLVTDSRSVRSDLPIVPLDATLWAGGYVLPSEVDAGAPFCLVYSSGTTGAAKAAVLTHGNVYWSAVGSAENLGVASGDRWLACMPLYHVGGLSIVVRSAIYGTTAVVHSSFEPAAVGGALREGRVSLLSLVPTMLSRLLELPDLAAPSLRAILVGGGAAAPALLAEARTRGLPVLPTFGLSEAASQVTTARRDSRPAEGSSGVAMLPSTLRVDRDGRRAGPDEVGALLVRGPTVMAGYFHRDGETAEVLRDGWLRTGDYGYLDAAGELHVVDRRDDLIVSGGENVYPAEVEQVLSSHPSIHEAAVVGLPDADLGQVVTAVVVARGTPPAAGELDAHVRAQLAGYKVPRRYVFRDAPLPRGELGKLLRRELRANLED